MSSSNAKHTPAPGSRLPQKDPELLVLERLMVDLVNTARAAQGRASLVNDPLLAAVARAHSAEMRDRDYFAHESPTPTLRSLVDRYELAFGRKPSYVAENLSSGTCRAWFAPDDPIENKVRQWLNKPLKPTREDIVSSHDHLMASPGHCSNILLSQVTRIGIGLVEGKGRFWITQMFSQ